MVHLLFHNVNGLEFVLKFGFKVSRHSVKDSRNKDSRNLYNLRSPSGIV